MQTHSNRQLGYLNVHSNDFIKDWMSAFCTLSWWNSLSPVVGDMDRSRAVLATSQQDFGSLWEWKARQLLSSVACYACFNSVGYIVFPGLHLLWRWLPITAVHSQVSPWNHITNVLLVIEFLWEFAFTVISILIVQSSLKFSRHNNWAAMASVKVWSEWTITRHVRTTSNL